MVAKLNFGLRVPAVHPTDVEKLRAFVVEAERLDFHSIWVGDHVFYHVDVLQPLDLLSWVAALTSRVRLGTAVMLTAYLNPVLLARSAATIDYLSGGRLTLGVSIGGTEAEYTSIGVPMNQRVGRLVETVAIIRKLWAEDDVSFKGRYQQIEHASIKPKPLQTPGVPVLFGANTDAMRRRLARVADGWIGSAATSPEAFASGVSDVKAFAQQQGRDPATLRFAKLHSISVHDDTASAIERAERQWKTYYGPRFNVEGSVILGAPEACAERLRAFKAADTSEVTLALEPPTLDLDALETLRSTVDKAD
jgi:probable F420-dependent oxidoreductase